MPTLKQYTADSEKSGYYILANVGGANPITLQVTTLGEQILRKTEYEAGDFVPTDIVWSMFDVGIMFTSSNINEPPDVTQDTDEIFHQLNVSNQLTDAERAELLNYLTEYTGPNEEQVAALRDDLQKDAESKRDEPQPNGIENDLDRLSRLHSSGELTTEEYEILKSEVVETQDQSTTEANEKKNHSKEYTCRSCGQTLTQPGWLDLLKHHQEHKCSLPDEKPERLTESQWGKLQSKVQRASDQPSQSRSSGNSATGKSESPKSERAETQDVNIEVERNDGTDLPLGSQQGEQADSETPSSYPGESKEYTCQSCGRTLTQPGWLDFLNHYQEYGCALPAEKPGRLNNSQWRKLQAKARRA